MAPSTARFLHAGCRHKWRQTEGVGPATQSQSSTGPRPAYCPKAFVIHDTVIHPLLTPKALATSMQHPEQRLSARSRLPLARD